MKVVRVVMALIRDKHARYLVQQRPIDKARANLWEFPGGKVEPGESSQEALKRECREELAVEIEVNDRLWGNRHAYSDLTVELEAYRAELTSGVPKPLSAQRVMFCGIKEMQALPFCEADLPLLEAIAQGRVR